MNRKYFLIPITAIFLMPSLTLAQIDLTHYRGKNRLLLVFAPSKFDLRWQKQNALLAHSQEAFRDRDLLRFDYFGSGGKALQERYGIKPNQFRVLLIGKDGHVASGGPTPISLSELTGQIDRMPMRREELRKRGHR